MVKFDADSHLSDLIQPAELYDWIFNSKWKTQSLEMVHTDLFLLKYPDGEIFLANMGNDRMTSTYLGNKEGDLQTIVTNLWEYIEINKDEIVKRVQATNRLEDQMYNSKPKE